MFRNIIVMELTSVETAKQLYRTSAIVLVEWLMVRWIYLRVNIMSKQTCVEAFEETIANILGRAAAHAEAR